MKFKKNIKYFSVWALACLFLMSAHYFYHGIFARDRTRVTLSQFVDKIRKGQFKKVELKKHETELEAVDGQGVCFYTQKGSYPIIELLDQTGVAFDTVPTNAFVEILTSLLVMLILPFSILVIAWFVLGRMRGNNQIFGLSKSKSKLVDMKKNTTTFQDVEGMEEVKEEVKEIVDFLKMPERFQAIGGRLPRGVLLEGPPGTGKTLLARAIAGEANVPFFSISGSEFVELFAGMGASRVRALFQQARENAPCLIFIDEIDAVGRSRSAARTVHEEREQTLNQLLVEMDGFENKEGVIVLAATNRAEVLDEALLRPGRFDRKVIISLPNLKEREKIIALHLKKIKTKEGISALDIARGTPGFSGADLFSLINESALFAARHHRKTVDKTDIDVCRDKILLGHERRSLSLLEEERRVIAYHEAGHAIVSYFCESTEPIHKATIMPRGQALGMVVSLPENDRVLRKRQSLLDGMCVLMAGRVSEELIFGIEHVTTGASNDFKQATHMAKMMVQEWGMSDAVGPIHVHHSQGWDGNSLGVFSQDTLQMVDREVNLLLRQAYERARALLTEHMDRLIALAGYLLSHETLTGDEVREVIETRLLQSNVLPSTVEDSCPLPSIKAHQQEAKEEKSEASNKEDMPPTMEEPSQVTKEDKVEIINAETRHQEKIESVSSVEGEPVKESHQSDQKVEPNHQVEPDHQKES